ncbi:chemotaxis protein [Halobellus salinus]|uniref:Chemotaxis protein n=1 Tax=Halobellus salinus TaxID=931585 RepID=A0A830ETY6_9EURY|nr:globin-coupled sensor protein [Halobellus salinus]GGJ09564.1 chemotaxis protein [Halobellus salinus]SMP27531.1 Methyl-accepting chemotaxis protein [Halobellus salinus]
MAELDQYGTADFGRGKLNDQLDLDALVDEIGLDSDEIAWRKEFIGFDEEDVERLSAYEQRFAENAEQVADDFYENLSGHDETVEVIGRSPKGLDALKRTQSAYLTTLVRGSYGTEYFRERARIGKLHDMLDMPMKQYLGQYGVYYDLILPLVGDALVESLTDRVESEVAGADGRGADGGDDPSRDAVETVVRAEVDDAIEDILSILRIINLDMQVVTDTYIHSYSERLEEEIQRNQRLMSEVQSDVEQPITELRDTSDEVTDSAAEITDTAARQSERVDEVSSEVSNLTATVEEVAATAEKVESVSERATDLAQEGQQTADEAVGVMDEINEEVDVVSADVDDLRQRIEQIDEFVETINGIANQTNLLALNASIEAARAGKAGDGFSVVADEIKSLAEESQSEAAEIEEMVSEIQADAEEAVASLEDMTEQVTEGIGGVEESMGKLSDITAATEETADGISEVSEATDDQAAAAEEISATVDEVSEQADRVATEVEELAAANEEQSAMVTEVERSVARLTEQEAAADGGVAHPGGGNEVSIPADLPDGMPEFVIESLSDERLRAIARGEVDAPDVV